jgi:small subunit ribosomal protein S4
MVRYTGPKLRVVRRLGRLPGLTTKKSKSKYLPGQHKKSKLAFRRKAKTSLQLWHY